MDSKIGNGRMEVDSSGEKMEGEMDSRCAIKNNQRKKGKLKERKREY